MNVTAAATIAHRVECLPQLRPAVPSRLYNQQRVSLTPGSRLGPYEIVAPLGAGGMGEVYRATDTKLKRQVAIKILPPSLAADKERLA